MAKYNFAPQSYFSLHHNNTGYTVRSLSRDFIHAINLIYSPEVIWFFYPLIGWVIGISMHYLFSVRWLEKELKEREVKAEYRAREMKK